jgi:23S rRNA A1618 N6-methylase RlmF
MKDGAMAAQPKDQIHQIITMNRQSGNTYTVKLKDIPSEFVGIPVPSRTDPDKFIMDVTNMVSEDENRIIEADIAQIEYIEES